MMVYAALIQNLEVNTNINKINNTNKKRWHQLSVILSHPYLTAVYYNVLRIGLQLRLNNYWNYQNHNEAK